MRIERSVLDRRDGAGVGIAFWPIVLAMLPGVLDQTILATALPTIASGHAGSGTLALAHAGGAEVISGVHIVFLAAAPAALVALVAVLALEEVPLRGPSRPAPAADGARTASGRHAAAEAAR